MGAFLDCTYTKEQALALAQRHYDHDQFAKGTYGVGEYGTTEFKGCSVGCMANGEHEDYLDLFGVIPQIAHLSDSIFEGLNVAESKEWTLQLFNAIKTGSNTKIIYYHFIHWLLVDENFGMIRFNDHQCIRNIANLHLKAVTETVTQEEWTAAAVDARSACDADARSGATAAYAALAAARAAARAATGDDDASAAAVGWYDADADAREKHYQLMRDKLIDLFSNEEIELV